MIALKSMHSLHLHHIDHLHRIGAAMPKKTAAQDLSTGKKRKNSDFLNNSKKSSSRLRVAGLLAFGGRIADYPPHLMAISSPPSDPNPL